MAWLRFSVSPSGSSGDSESESSLLALRLASSAATERTSTLTFTGNARSIFRANRSTASRSCASAWRPMRSAKIRRAWIFAAKLRGICEKSGRSGIYIRKAKGRLRESESRTLAGSDVRARSFLATKNVPAPCSPIVGLPPSRSQALPPTSRASASCCSSAPRSRAKRANTCLQPSGGDRKLAASGASLICRMVCGCRPNSSASREAGRPSVSDAVLKFMYIAC